MKDQPQNKEGQTPTSSPEETVDRLEQKKHEGFGTANRDRIEVKEREMGAVRPASAPGDQ
jgi:hypothetical protein